MDIRKLYYASRVALTRLTSMRTLKGDLPNPLTYSNKRLIDYTRELVKKKNAPGYSGYKAEDFGVRDLNEVKEPEKYQAGNAETPIVDSSGKDDEQPIKGIEYVDGLNTRARTTLANTVNIKEDDIKEVHIKENDDIDDIVDLIMGADDGSQVSRPRQKTPQTDWIDQESEKYRESKNNQVSAINNYLKGYVGSGFYLPSLLSVESSAPDINPHTIEIVKYLEEKPEDRQYIRITFNPDSHAIMGRLSVLSGKSATTDDETIFRDETNMLLVKIIDVIEKDHGPGHDFGYSNIIKNRSTEKNILKREKISLN